ncbi:MAG: CRISPR-associated helicase Cas3', partial [Anaerolineales bacterium]|nr:CRISPR-associated helicase Cas3' [Anaerolineales bacterium]
MTTQQDVVDVSIAGARPGWMIRCWGKTGSETAQFHPALFHMIDTGHVARALLQPPASPRWQGFLVRSFGQDARELSEWLPFAVALHDIGKVSAAFQSKLPDQRARLVAEGLDFAGWRDGLDMHHTEIGQAAIDGELGCLELPDAMRQVWTDTVGGHHGRFRPPASAHQVQQQLRRHEPRLWAQLRGEAVRALYSYFLPNGVSAWEEPANLSTATMTLTGFTILCDWLGSDERFFAPSAGIGLEEYLAVSEARAQSAVREAGFLRSSLSAAPTTFEALFDDKRPARPLQLSIDAIPGELLSRPCLAIIEAPTGEGKTEAALALAHRLAQAHGSDEFYYALPTTATSNQMATRLRDHLSERLAMSAGVKLIHGQAFLLGDDLDPKPLPGTERIDSEAIIEWFSSRKRALLAPFGVGTVDQAELAALNVKHSSLRLIGLAGKVLLFDEVHAYDTYMTTIVETLLEWLSALGTSVIILSATLPKMQREKLAHAYGVAPILETGAADAYPSLWVLRPGRDPYHVSPQAFQPARRLALNWLHAAEDAATEKARWLVQAVAEGGCACWISNTVGHAQALTAALQEMDLPLDTNVMLLHARFPLDERQDREQRLTGMYGPRGQRPVRGIVIGTQVLEQSLDLDFDIMVSDLAPVDLLLQRAGRLQRHQLADPRPGGYEGRPALWINAPLTAEGAPALGADAYVYDKFLLQRTWTVLQGRRELALPRDYRPLVEAVYGVDPPASDDPLAESYQRLQIKQSEAKHEAQQRLLPEPDPAWSFCAAAAMLTFEENETGAAWVVAQTRLGEESVNLIPLEQEGGQARLWPDGDPLALDRAASREQQLAMLRRQLHVSRCEIVKATREADLPPLFSKSPRLKGYYPLWLSDGQAVFPAKGGGALVARLDPELGLVIDRDARQK